MAPLTAVDALSTILGWPGGAWRAPVTSPASDPSAITVLLVVEDQCIHRSGIRGQSTLAIVITIVESTPPET